MTDWTKLTRGERNNNPGNIKEFPGDPTTWEGERATDDDPVMEEYETPFHGIRALAKVFKNYQKKYGLTTIRAIISRWAPPTENDTEAYVKFVVEKCGVWKPEEPVDLLSNRQFLRRLALAVILFENGRCMYSDQLVFEAVEASYDGV